MQRLPLLIELIFQKPKLSDRKIGLRVGRTPRTVRRYINAVDRKQLSWSHLRHLGPRALDRRLNRRRGPPRKRLVDLEAVAQAVASGLSLRKAWRAYAIQDPETAVSYVHFLRICHRRRVGRNTAIKARSLSPRSSCKEKFGGGK